MPLARRALLLSAPYVFIRPAHATGLRLEPAGDAATALTGPGVRTPLLLPTAQARLAPKLPVGGHDLAMVRLVLHDGPATLEIAVIAQLADTSIHLLALEPLVWRGADGARLTTQMASVGDRSRLRFLRESALPRGPTRSEREGWTDYLAWQAPAGLVDAPVRPPLADTRQHVLAHLRHAAAAMVAAAPQAITTDMLARIGFQAATFSLSVSAQLSMRHTPSGPRSIV